MMIVALLSLSLLVWFDSELSRIEGGFLAGSYLIYIGYLITKSKTSGKQMKSKDQEEEDDGEPFDDKMKRLTSLLKKQQEQRDKLDRQIAENLKKIGYEI